MTIADYTSFDDVRAALGVSKDEISDATLSLDLYTFNLVSELEAIDLSLIAAYEALPVSLDTRSAAEVRFAQSVSLFSTYAVAKQGTIALPMFSPKEQTDGKAGLVRFAQDPYKATKQSVIDQYNVFRQKLEAAYFALQPAVQQGSTARTYISVVSPLSDPVLGT